MQVALTSGIAESESLNGGNLPDDEIAVYQASDLTLAAKIQAQPCHKPPALRPHLMGRIRNAMLRRARLLLALGNLDGSNFARIAPALQRVVGDAGGQPG